MSKADHQKGMKDRAYMFILTPSEIQGQMWAYFVLNNKKKNFTERETIL